MKKGKNPVVYILIGVLAAAAFVAVWSLIGLLIGNVKSFGDGLKDIVHLICGAIFGAGVASSLWKKDDKEEE